MASFPHAQYHQMAREPPTTTKKKEPCAGNTHPQIENAVKFIAMLIEAMNISQNQH